MAVPARACEVAFAAGVPLGILCRSMKSPFPRLRTVASDAAQSARPHDALVAESTSPAPLARLKKLLARPAVVTGLLVLAGFLVLGLDMPIAEAVRYGKANDFLAKLCDLSEVFGHGVGVVTILAIAYLLDPTRRTVSALPLWARAWRPTS